MVRLGEGTYGVVWTSKDGTEAVKEFKKPGYRQTINGSYVRSMAVCSLRRPTDHHVVETRPISEGRLRQAMGLTGAYPRLQTLSIRMPLYKMALDAKLKCFDRATINVQQILLDVATAVDYLHANWIVHRDIKAANILLDQDDRAYLGDFDLSQQWSARNLEDKGYVMESDCVYTVHYRPPETMLACCELRRQTIEQQMRGDVWSLGIVALDLIDASQPTLTMWRTAPNVIGDAQKMVPSLLAFFGLSSDGWLMRHHRSTLKKLKCSPCPPTYALDRKWPENIDERYKYTMHGMLQTDPDQRFSAAQVMLGLGGEPSTREPPIAADENAEMLTPPFEVHEKILKPYAAYYYTVYTRSPPPLRNPPSAKIVAVAAGALAYTYVSEVTDELLESLSEFRGGNSVVRTVQLWIIALLDGNLALPDHLLHQVFNTE